MAIANSSVPGADYDDELPWRKAVQRTVRLDYTKHNLAGTPRMTARLHVACADGGVQLAIDFTESSAWRGSMEETREEFFRALQELAMVEIAKIELAKGKR